VRHLDGVQGLVVSVPIWLSFTRIALAEIFLDAPRERSTLVTNKSSPDQLHAFAQALP